MGDPITSETDQGGVNGVQLVFADLHFIESSLEEDIGRTPTIDQDSPGFEVGDDSRNDQWVVMRLVEFGCFGLGESDCGALCS